MTYSTPVTTIASIGTPNTPIPVTIESVTEPTERPGGNPLQVGDIWYDNVKKFESIYILSDNFGNPGWQAVGGEDYVREIAATTVPSVLDLPIATESTVGVVKVGTGLQINTFGDLSVTPNETFQTINVNGTATLHSIITGADVTSGIAINASAGEITAQWLNVGKNPTIVTSDSNYNVSLRTSGDIVTHDITADQIHLNSSITAVKSIITNMDGPRQGVVYKLNAGDGVTFEGQAHQYIGGTVGNDYHTNVGTLGVNATVLRNTGTQTINGDIEMTSAGAAGGSINMNTIKFKLNYSNGNQIGTPDVGRMAFINSAPAYGNGSAWVPLTGGSGTTYTLPIASANLLGGIKIGSGLTIDATTGICDADAAVLLNGGGQITSGNVILDSGYVRVDNDLGTDAAFEARLGSDLKFKVMANGGIAIGGTIDDSTNQNSAQVSIRSTGSCTFKGKVDVNKLAFLSNFADAASAGTPTLGLITMIDSAPYFGNGTQWVAIQLGQGLNLE